MEKRTQALVHGDVIGRFLDHDIYDWVEDPYGQRYFFASAIPGAASRGVLNITLQTNQCVIVPGLLYQTASTPIEAFLPAGQSDIQYL
ncbi:hypothetical protein [Gulbenkiania mobilis]|uniref:hypothetical protein n=1 Tax=Gulbenkiania mobilis TaxID=397457 RepID=UPI00128F8FC8|nr:hypothetical protein [Gulbenkiania mobilis]